MDGAAVGEKNCNLTPEQNSEARFEEKCRRLLATRVNVPGPQNKSNFKVKRSFGAPVPIMYFDHLREPGASRPEDRVPPGIRARARARAKELKDLSVSSEQNQKIYQSPFTKAFAELQV